MKKKLLFTAVVVAAMSGAMVPVLALQNSAETEAGFMAGEAGEEDEAVYTDVTTEFVVNASCTVDGGWSRDPQNASRFFVVDDSRLYSEVYKSKGIEFYTKPEAPVKNCDLIYQDITGLPNGTYRLTAFAVGRNQTAGKNDICDTGLYLFANKSETRVTSNVWGKFSTIVEVNDNKLRIGLRAGDDNNNNWLVISRVVLEYKGSEIEYYQQALSTKVDYIHTLGSQYEANGDVPTLYSSELKNYQAASCTEISQYQEEIKKIDDKIASIINDVKNPFYVAYKSTEDYASNVLIKALEGTKESAKGTLRSAIASAKAKAVASTDKAVWKEANKELEQACKAYYEASSGIKSEVKDFDVTRLVVKNAGFEDTENPVDGWNGLSENEVQDGVLVKGYNVWSTWDFSQTVEKLPNGKYTMSAQLGISISDRHFLYLYSSQMYKESIFKDNGYRDLSQCASWASDTEKDRWTISDVLVTDGKITMGAKYTAKNKFGSMFFDNFRLVRVSDGADEIIALYNQTKLEGEAIDMDLLTDVFKKPLEEALKIEQPSNVDEYYAAYNKMKQPVNDAKNSIPATSAIRSLLEECQLYYENSYASAAVKQAFYEVIEKAKGYNEFTTVEELQNCAEQFETARREFVEQAVPTGDVKFDMTYLLTNPDVSGMNNDAYVDGWLCDYFGGKNFVVRVNPNVCGQTGLDRFFEAYCYAGAFPENTWVIYQKANIPVGHYEMTAYAFASNAAKFALYAGENKGDEITSAVLTPGKVEFTQNEGKELNLGIKTEVGNQTQWFGMNCMKLYKTAPKTMALKETDEAYNVEADTYTNVTVNRVLKAEGKWNTFCVPFAMTADQLKENKITEVRKLESVKKNGESVVLNFSEPVTEIEAGVPYIVKADEPVSQIIVNGVVVKAAAPQTLTDDNVSMQGNYASMTITGDKYFISDNKFYRAADKTITVNGFRAYITFSDAQAAGINTMFINIDGEVTAIDEAVEDVSDELVNVYTMNGVCVKAGVKASEALNGLQRGAYIVNGKKVIK